MASKKKQSEGIALLSLYNDEDDEMEDAEEEDHEEKQGQQLQQQQQEEEIGEANNAEEETSAKEGEIYIGGDSGNDNTPPITNESKSPQQAKASHTPTSQHGQQMQVMQLESRQSRRERLTIVDYAHDEFAMSPEPEEGEMENGGRVMFGSVLQTADGILQEKISVEICQGSTPSIQGTPQSFEHPEPPQSHTASNAATKSESVEVEDNVKTPVEESKPIDPLDRFLPPPPKEKCSNELQEKINKFLNLKKAGKSFNAEVRNRKDYRNPDFLLHAVRYQDIDQIGSCFSKDVFDPHGYDPSDYYDEIEADMKREMERKEQERKKNQKVEFVSGGSQPQTVAASKINMPLSGVSSVAGSALHSVPSAVVDATARDGRLNKKSKWDKVDTGLTNPIPSGGQDSISKVGAHAALLSAANAGAGYMAFAQQRRREAEEKKSSEKKLDRRS